MKIGERGEMRTKTVRRRIDTGSISKECTPLGARMFVRAW